MATTNVSESIPTTTSGGSTAAYFYTLSLTWQPGYKVQALAGLDAAVARLKAAADSPT